MAAAGAATAGAGAGRWEVVRKGRRGPAGGTGNRRALGEANGGRALPLPAPIATSSTIFQLGFERPLRKQNKEQVPPAAAPEPPQRKQHPGKSGKKPPGSEAGAKPGRCRSLEEALKALDLADLQKELEKSKSVFPENPSVWVKDLAGYLNYKLQAPRSDPVLSQHPHDYPYCLVSKELRSIIRSLLGKASGVLELFFDHCIYTMLQELDKASGESLHGYRICIQALLLDRPRIATTNLGKYLEVLRSQQNRPAKCLTVLWALGQAGFSDLHEGLKVWLGVMLPVLGIKSLSPYAVSYLDRLLMMHPNLTKGFGMIGPKDFFPLLDFTFMPNNSLSPSLQEQLRRLYPRLKVLAFGARPEAALHTYFPSFLSRATPACPPAMKKELLTSMSQCLSLDPLSFSVWRQLYTKHLAQSRSVQTVAPGRASSLQETVRSFKVTNEELAARGTAGDQDVAACDTACKELLHKMKGRGFPWSRLLLVLLVFAAGFFLHDVQTHGSFQGTVGTHRTTQLTEILWEHQSCSRGWCSPHAVSLLHSSRTGSPRRCCTSPSACGSCCCSCCGAACCPCCRAWLQCCSGAGRAASTPASEQPLLPLLELCSPRGPSPRCCSCLSLSCPQSCPADPAPVAQGAPVSPCHSSFLPVIPPVIPCPCFSSGDVTWECVRDHLMSFTYSLWIYLQNATLALKNWALAMISGH
uniref:Transmembrane protein 214 n=1 Tax=Catharus ustulatus TaxID=91951 RepID=A0A8C3U408_CATUS